MKNKLLVLVVSIICNFWASNGICASRTAYHQWSGEELSTIRNYLNLPENHNIKKEDLKNNLVAILKIDGVNAATLTCVIKRHFVCVDGQYQDIPKVERSPTSVTGKGDYKCVREELKKMLILESNCDGATMRDTCKHFYTYLQNKNNTGYDLDSLYRMAQTIMTSIREAEKNPALPSSESIFQLEDKNQTASSSPLKSIFQPEDNEPTSSKLLRNVYKLNKTWLIYVEFIPNSTCIDWENTKNNLANKIECDFNGMSKYSFKHWLYYELGKQAKIHGKCSVHDYVISEASSMFTDIYSALENNVDINEIKNSFALFHDEAFGSMSREEFINWIAALRQYVLKSLSAQQDQ